MRCRSLAPSFLLAATLAVPHGVRADAGAGPAETAPTPAEARAVLTASLDAADLEPCLRTWLEASADAAVGEHEAAVAGFVRALEQAIEHPTAVAVPVAIASISRLRQAFRHFPRAWVAPAVRAADVPAAPDSEWLGIRERLLSLRADLAYAEADVDAAARDIAASGNLIEWVGTGPEGPTALDRWWRDPPDGDRLHPAPWRLPVEEPARPPRTWKPEEYLGTLTLGPREDVRPGVLRIAAVIDVPEGLRTMLLRIVSTHGVLVRIDGTEVARRDPFREPIGAIHEFAIDPRRGRHRLDLQIPSPYGRPGISVALAGIDAGGGAVAIRGSADLSVETPAVWTGRVRLQETGAFDGWAALPAVEAAATDGRSESASRWARALADDPALGDEPLVLVTAAARVLEDPTLSLPEGRRLASAYLDRLGPLADALLGPLTIRARWALDDDDLDDAIELLRSAAETFPADPDLLESLYDAYQSRNWVEEMRRVVETASLAWPGACSGPRFRLSLAYDLGLSDRIREAAREVAACTPSSFDVGDTLRRERRWAEAAAEVERLRALYSDPFAPDWTLALLRLARGNLEGLEAWLRERRRALPVEGGSRDLLHDLLLRTDRPAEAAALWEDAFDRGEVGMVGLEIPAALRNVDPFAALFIPARQAIAAYEARRGPDEAPSTQVLDHTVSRILDDGSILMLTHTVLKLSSQEAVEAYGQSGGGGGMLAARTIGADGTVTDVVNLSEAGVGSFPNLTPGCYVETFSARLAPASPMLRGGTDHWRFYFRSRDELMARTEFVLAAPSDYPLDFSPRGSPPPLQERTLDALTLRRWAATDVPPLRSEPLSVSSDAYIPSIRVARGFDWDVAMSGLGEALYASDYVPLEVADFARDLCRGLDRDGCARTVYDWILDEIESGGVTESITSTFQRRSGARARLALAMLEANGFPVELYFATSLERDLVETPVAESSRYYYPVLRVGDTWLTIEADEAPFGFLPPEIRGMPAAVFRPREQAFRTVVLPRGTDEEGFHMRLDLEVDPDTGNVRVEGVMEAHGAFAADFRDGLKERSPADWEGDLTGVAVSPSFPGAEVERIAVEGLEDREGPLRIVFTATARGLALRRGGAILLPPLMPQQFTGGYAPLPSIENPAVSFPPKILDLEVRVRAPGYAPAAPPGAAIDTDWVSFEQTIRETEEGGVLHRRVRIGMGRLEPEQYAPFAQAVRRAESLWNIPFELRRSR